MAKPKSDSPDSRPIVRRPQRKLRTAELNPSRKEERIRVEATWLHTPTRVRKQTLANLRSRWRSAQALLESSCHLSVYFRAHYPGGITDALRRERTFFNNAGKKQKAAYRTLIDETLKHATKSLAGALRFADKQRVSDEEFNDWFRDGYRSGIDFDSLTAAESKRALAEWQACAEQQGVILRFSEIVPSLLQLFISPAEAFGNPRCGLAHYLDPRLAPARWGKWMFLSPSIRSYFEDADPETQLTMLMEIQPDPVADVPDKVGRTEGTRDRSNAPRQNRARTLAAKVEEVQRSHAEEAVRRLGKEPDERLLQAYQPSPKKVAAQIGIRPNTIAQQNSRKRKRREK